MLFSSCCGCRLAGMCRNPLLWPYISQPVGFSLPPFVLSREVFADVFKGGMSVIKKCHGCFLGSAKYIQILHTFCTLELPGRHRRLLVLAGPALWSDPRFPFWPSKSITVDFAAWRCCHVSCTLSAIWRRYIATGLLTSTRLASSPGETWQFPKMIRIDFVAELVPTEKS